MKKPLSTRRPPPGTPASPFKFVDGGLTGEPAIDNGYCDFRWIGSLVTGVLSTSLPRVSGNTITEYDVTFNDVYNWGDGATTEGVYDIQTAALHEFGHMLGLVDIWRSDGVMDGGHSPIYLARSLAAGDAAGAAWIYGQPPAPAVSSVAPTSGAEAGGTQIVITGQHFLSVTGASGVSFDGVNAATYHVDSDTQITAVTPPHSRGLTRVIVQAPVGRSNDTPADDFTFLALSTGVPTITSMTPVVGSTAGGSKVVVTGTHFTGSPLNWDIMFGTARCMSYDIDSPTKLTLTTPAHAAGKVRVQMTTEGGTTADSAADDYTYVAPIRYDDLDAHVEYSAGWSGYSTASAYLGSYKRASASASWAAVYFTGERLDWIAMTGTTTGVADVFIDGAYDATINLAAASAKYKVNVYSTGWLPWGVHEVWIQPSAANPAGKYIDIDAVDVVGTILYPPATITGLDPSLGPTSGGNSVVITGAYFYGVTGAGGVRFDGVNASSYIVNSPTRITAVAPPRTAATVRVQVFTPTGSSWDSAANDYIYGTIPAPTVAGLSPASGSAAGGATVTITGTNFYAVSGAPGVTFGGVNATSFTVDSPTRITAVAPPHAVGTVDVVVTSATGSSVAAGSVDDFTYEAIPTRYEQTDERIARSGTWTDYAAPKASGLSYGRASSAGAKATIYFTGTRLDWIAMKGTTTGIADVYLDGAKYATVDLAASVATYDTRVWTSGPLDDIQHVVEIVRSDSSASGKYLTLDAIEVTGALAYAPPAITSLSPLSGSTGGGTSVVINGTSFVQVSAVTFGGTPAGSVTVNSPTQITAVAPAHAAGTADVVVTAAGGTSKNTVADNFVYSDAPVSMRYEQTEGLILKTGAWTNYPGAKASGTTYGRSSTAGASATICFMGTRLDWIAMKGTTTGIADVYLDGAKVTTVDLAASVAAYNIPVWSTGTLPDGQHTVRIVRSDSSAASKYLTLDAVDIWGAIAPAPTHYEQSDSHMVRVGSWTSVPHAKASGGSYSRSNTTSPPSQFTASVTIYFTGTQLDWMAMRNGTAGSANVFVDGAQVGTVVLGSSTAICGTVWSTGTLLYGDHVVRIERAGVGGTSYLTLDGVDIWGTIRTGP